MEITSQMLYYNNSKFDMSTAARIINRGIGRNQLYKILKTHGVIDCTNKPHQQFIDAGYFEFKQPQVPAQDGYIDGPYSVAYIKPSGIYWIRDNIDLGLPFQL